MARKDSPDAALIERAQQGDRAATEALILGQMGRMHAVCTGLIRNREVASELAQEAVLRLYKSIPRFRGDCAWSTWSYRIAKNLCLNWLEKMREDVGNDGTLLEDPRPDALQETAEDQRAVGVRAALESLSELERQAMLLHYESGLSVDEVTEILGLTNKSGARGVLQRARRKLKKQVAAAMPEDSIVRRAAPPEPVREAMERTLFELTRTVSRDAVEPELSRRTRTKLLD
ncbi:MAG: sigma-70 family RNA polymerase sigma factor [Proteobacteria bacterium]|nr:sigma-70 family RNA polymerase sigma factor [Pseudomonadota bacterium]MCP4915538.1 sigma-70 family RNA polymerase sigma factor [Pseudomonadota bacterium]